MKTLLCAALLLVPTLGWSQDDPLPYSDEHRTREPSSTPRPESAPSGEGTEKPRGEGGEQTLSAKDDPSLGLGGALRGGLMLLSSSRGELAEPQAGFGAQLTWDFGRLLDDPWLHEGFFLDVNWLSANSTDGTTNLRVSTWYHFFTAAPAFEVPFGLGSAYGVYASVGGGVALESSTLRANGVSTSQSALLPVLQYGLGFRGRPVISEDGKLRLTFRVEALRYRRGYLDDTYVGGNLGLAY